MINNIINKNKDNDKNKNKDKNKNRLNYNIQNLFILKYVVLIC